MPRFGAVPEDYRYRRTTPMRISSIGLAALATSVLAAAAQAQLNSPMVGSRAELSSLAHGVSGAVTIVDEDTIRVDDFTYDGGGIVVYFYLGESDSIPAFSSGVPIGPDLLGMSFDGSQDPLTYDLPAGQTLEGLHAISVWCVAANANFGSGTFIAPSFPDGDFNRDGAVDAADYTTWRDGLGTDYDLLDYDAWKGNFGATAAGTGSALTAANVPEPGGVCLMAAMTIAAGQLRSPRRPVRPCGCGCSRRVGGQRSCRRRSRLSGRCGRP